MPPRNRPPLLRRAAFSRLAAPLVFTLLTFPFRILNSFSDTPLPSAPSGFKVTLFAKDPDIAHPTALTAAPGGVVFASEDYWNAKRPGVPQTTLIKRFVDRDGDGVSDEMKIFCGDSLGSVQGLRWFDGALYAMHAPLLTVFRDADGDGKPEERKDILVGDKPDSKTDVAGHLISGLDAWIDGRLYITCGDEGWWRCKTPEGKEFELHGGGILRCWPDGKGLEPYCTGLRNPYGTMAIDADGNGFTVDNTNDGKGWNERFSQIFRFGFYGYPYHFKNYPEEIVPCLDDYGGGSPTGGVCYLEDRFPEEYRGNLFVNEWGGRIVYRITFKADGAVLRPTRKEFLTGGSDGGYIFRPIAIDVDEDGNLLVADWAQDGWDKGNGKGRIFRVSPAGAGGRAAGAAKKKSVDGWAADLSSPRYSVRFRAQRELEHAGSAAASKLHAVVSSGPAHARVHAMWALARVEKDKAAPLLIKQLDASEERIRLHAARILGDGGVGAGGVDALIARLSKDTPRGRIECAAALGGLKAVKAAPALLKAAAVEDVFVHRLIAYALRATGETAKTAEALNDKDPLVRDAALLALRERYEIPAVQGLILASRSHPDAAFRVRLVRALARVGKKPKPWDGAYWSFWPNVDEYPFGTESWEGTEMIVRALEALAGDAQADVKAQAELALKIVGARGAGDASADAQNLPKTYKDLAALLRQTTAPVGARLAACAALRKLSDLPAADAKARDGAIAGFAKTLASGSVEVKLETIQALPASRAPFAGSWLTERLGDGDARVREAALRALVDMDDPAAPAAAKRLLAEKAPEVRRAAVRVYGKLAGRGADPAPLQALLKDPDRDLAREAMAAMIQIKGGAAQALPEEALTPFVRRWLLVGPFPDADGKGLDAALPPERELDLAAQYDGDGARVGWKDAASETDTVSLTALLGPRDRAVGYALAVAEASEDCEALLLVGSDDGVKVWVNGELAHVKKAQRTIKPDEDVFRARLRKGPNAVLVKVSNAGGEWGFCLRAAAPRARALLAFPAPREAAADTRRARLSQLALQGGDPAAGEAVFRGAKANCVKCHAAKGAGGKIAPDLSSVGAKYLRPFLIESILYPSRKLAQGFQAVALVTTDERVVSGIVTSETGERVMLVGSDGNAVEVRKSDIAERQPQTVSIMPEGLERALTDQEFVDVTAFLESLK